MDLQKLLSLLADGNYHSGSELGDSLGVSRTSIWKCLPQLQALNIPIETVKGKGYRIPDGLDLLDVNSIFSKFPPHVLQLLAIDILLECSSTNDYLLQNKNFGKTFKYHACLTEFQASGRGRRGRTWVSPFGKNLTLSLGFVINGGVESLSGLSLIVGIAVARSLVSLGVENVGLKWPNDVYVDNKKIAGILIELSGEATTQWNVVCGIGLNVLMAKSEGLDIEQDWVALKNYIKSSRNEVATVLLNNLLEVLELFERASFKDFVEEWNRFDILKGQEVQVSPEGIIGKVLGVNGQGGLEIDIGGEKQLINAGEVSVRSV